jgi:branched-chain amino acid transport system ATP-binding protein
LTGSITFGEKSLHSMRKDEIVKAGVSHVPEGRQVFPGLSVVENLNLRVLKIKQVPRSPKTGVTSG